MVGNPYTFPLAHPLKGNNQLSEQGRITPLEHLLTTFAVWSFLQYNLQEKMEDTKISLIGEYISMQTYFSDCTLTKPELESEQACDIKQIFKNCCFIKRMTFY